MIASCRLNNCENRNKVQQEFVATIAIDDFLRKSHYVGMEDIVNAAWLREKIGEDRGVQAELAQTTGVSPDKINKILKGVRRVQADEVPLFKAFFMNRNDPEAVADRAEFEAVWSKLSHTERQTLITVGKGLHAQRRVED